MTKSARLFWSAFDQSGKEGYPVQNTAGHTKKTNLICQERLDDSLPNIGRPITERKTMDDEGCPHGLVYFVSSVESDIEYSSTGYSSTRCSDKDDSQTAEIVNDKTEHEYSSIDEKDGRIAGANKKAKFGH